MVEAALVAETGDTIVTLAEPEKFVGYRGAADAPQAILLKNNDLHAEIWIDATHNIGADDAAHVADIFLESAVTTIMDCGIPWPRLTAKTRLRPIAICLA